MSTDPILLLAHWLDFMTEVHDLADLLVPTSETSPETLGSDLDLFSLDDPGSFVDPGIFEHATTD